MNLEAVSPANHSIESIDSCGKSRIGAQLRAHADRSWRAHAAGSKKSLSAIAPERGQAKRKAVLGADATGEPSPSVNVAGVSPVPAQMWQG